MNVKTGRYPLLFVLVPLLIGLYHGWAQAKSEGKAPVIVNAYAVDNGQYGTIWKIYIEAEDPDGNMLRIASVVTQTGYGQYPTNWTYIKSTDQKHFKGYLQWNTFSSKAGSMPEWTQIALHVSVFDKAGNESNTVVFPFSLEMGVSAKSIAAPFDQGELPRLGYIHLDLINPFMGNVHN